MWNSMEEFIADMQADGCIKSITGEGEDADIDFNWQVLEVKHPTVYRVLWEEHNREIDDALSNLTDMGLLEMSFKENEDGSLEALYGLSDAGREYVKAMGLDKH